MIKIWIRRFALIAIATTLLAIGINMLLAPHKVVAGGITGVALLLESTIGLDRALVTWIGNGIMLGLVILCLSREVLINTVIGASLLPLFLWLIPRVQLFNSTAVAVVVGGLIVGVGFSLLYFNKASSGGTTVPPLILKKYFNLKLSTGIIMTEALVILPCAFIFGGRAFILSVFTATLASTVVWCVEHWNVKRSVRLNAST
jgi:uncharacterized membrane-anchored protein YitT (DUF2179 family)